MPKKDLQTELNECSRVLAIQGAEADELWRRVQKLRQQANDLERHNVPAPPHADNRKADRHQQHERRLLEHQNQIAALRAEAAVAERQLEKLQPAVTAARKRAEELRQAIEAERESRIAEAVRRAAETAPGRVEYLKERDRLTALRAKVVAVEHELNRLRADPPSKEDLSENRIKELLASGEFSEVQAQDAGALIKQLSRKLMEGHTAIRRQEGVIQHAQRRFCDQVTANLKPVIGDIISRIADGYGSARLATLEAGILRIAYNGATGDSDNLPSFVSTLVQAHQGATSVWEMQLAKWRQQGFAV